LRDAFMAAKSIQNVDSMQLTDRVKRILHGKVDEYFRWKEASYNELKNRERLQLAYLKSQVNALKLYASWIRPYLVAAKRLQMKPHSSKKPEMVSSFNVLAIELGLVGFKPVEFRKMKETSDGRKAYSVIKANFEFRSSPTQQYTEKRQPYFVQKGKFIITFEGYALTEEELETLKSEDLDEVQEYIEGMLDTSLDVLRDDIDKFMAKLENIVEEEAKPTTKPIGERIRESIKSQFKPLTEFFGGSEEKKASTKDKKKNKRQTSQGNYEFRGLMAQAKSSAKDETWKVMEIYKKDHGMIAW